MKKSLVLNSGLSLMALTASLAMAGPVWAKAKTAPVATQPRVIYADVTQELHPYPSPYARYLVGRVAMASGDFRTAAQAMSDATMADPQDADLREKAFLISLLGGEVDRSAEMAKTMKPASDTSEMMIDLLGVVTAVKTSKNADALKHVDALLKLKPGDRNGVLLRPYILALNGKWKDALDGSKDAALESNDRDRLLSYLVKSNRARLNEIRGKPADAESLYVSLYQPGAASFIFGPDYAGFLERQGRKDEAKAIWQNIASQTNDVVAIKALKRIDSPDYKAPPLPDLKEGISNALFVSATLSASEHDNEFALANLNLSRYLDNGSDRESIFLGQLLQELKDNDAAEAAWASVPVTSPFYTEATLRRVWVMRGDDKLDQALALVDQALARDPDNLSLIIEKTGILHSQEKDTDALALMNGRIQRVGDTDFGWQAWYMQAIVYDSLNRWTDAEAAIKKAQAINGKQPEILNFLGYGWISRGINIQAGMDLVREAIKVNPKSGAVVDSLGWGYYKLGEYEQALNFVEQAVQMEPADPEINEHLGDVYKALGRNAEAGYEWQRVLTLKTTDRQAAAVRKKIDDNVASQKIAVGKPAPVATKTALNDDHKPKP
ncbi:tetratricopeptide repeat protein [Asticcacaulis sp. 201]|uniref:tetratricopeptide repeat protein n=1 Tax=Asticcacaulis sp. 201 TaxID=3028787 RepID=UPI0029163490|nr:tetratricopeptide repeat protein [Asticcacaulis sp. 201]MDV6329584.1 tetratricopeptide repeat protein [Asticcacaulis sp. 201]